LQRSQGCQQALDKNPNIKVVAKESANWDETEGYKARRTCCRPTPTSRPSSARATRWAWAPRKAAQDAGKEIITVGIDGFPTMIAGIKAGLTDATQAQVPYKMGQLAVTDTLQILGGGAAVPAEQYQDTVLVTAENVNTVNPEDFYGPNVK
jgi:ribose transport system substrate-binding protein